MTGATLGLDLSGFIASADKADRKLQDMVRNSAQLRSNLSQALSDYSSASFLTLMERISGHMDVLSKAKIGPKFDVGNANEMFSILDSIIKHSALLTSGDKPATLFDNKSLNATNIGIMEAKNNLALIEQQIKTVEEKWSKTFLDSYQKVPFATPKFEPKINEKTGKPYGDNTQAQQRHRAEHAEKVALAREWEAAFNQHQEVLFRIAQEKNRRELELERSKLNEEHKAALAQLEWVKKTESEKTSTIEKEDAKKLAAEQKHISDVQREYKKLLADQLDAQKKIANLEKADIGTEGSKANAEYIRQFLERDARRRELEEQYGAYLVSIAEDAQRKILDLEVKRIKDRQAEEAKAQEEYNKTVTGANKFSRNAKTINEEKQAIEYLIQARNNLSKENSRYQQIVDALNSRIQKHRVSVEQLTTAEKNEQTLQPTIRNEYSRLLKELDKLTEAKKRASETKAFMAGDADAQKYYNDIIAREQDVRKRIADIEKAAQGQLDETKRKHLAERAQMEVAETVKLEARKAEIARKRLQEQMAYNSKFGTVSAASANRLINITSSPQNVQNVQQEQLAVEKLIATRKQLDKNDVNYQKTLDRINKEIEQHTHNIKMATDAQYAQNKAREAERAKNTTYQGAMDYSKQTKSIEEQKKAIDYLKEAREKLDKSTMSKSEYENKMRRLTNEINRQQKEIDRLTGKNDKLKNSHRGLMDTAGQLARKLAGIFSVRAITGYAQKLMEVRGEFEKQQRSLQAIIQDVDEANKLWDKTVALAVRSPFRVKELVTYTKQLAAYRVETDKLYDRTRMLADISAGLGVDMNRLILAYGQVKAANYLRGTELRQFSEAGVNVLKELSDYFTELEGRAVSVGDVFERVSKRMVSFEDVDAVLQKITSAGGIFYQMQEKQSETLQGMRMNLQDSIDLMLNDIGKRSDSALKASVEGVKFLVDNWRTLEPIIWSAGAAFIARFGVSQLRRIVGGFRAIGDAIQNMRRGVTSLTVPWGAVAAIIAAVVALILKARQAQSELNEAMSEIENNASKNFGESVVRYQELTKAIQDVTKSTLERDKAYEELQEQFKTILPDQLLERKYIDELTGSYDRVKDAMHQYYSEKSAEQKRDKIRQLYEKDLNIDISDLTTAYKTKFKDFLSLGVITDKEFSILAGGIETAIRATISEIENGELGIEELGNAISDKIFTYADISELELTEGPLTKRITYNLRQITESVGNLKSSLDAVKGFTHNTYLEDAADKEIQSVKSKISKTEEIFKNALSYYSKIIDLNSKIEDSENAEQIADLKKQVDTYKEAIAGLIETDKGFEGFKSMLESLFGVMKEKADEGVFEFNKSIQQMEQMLLQGIRLEVQNQFANSAAMTGSLAAKALGDNFIEVLNGRISRLDLTDFQRSVVQGAEMIAAKFDVDVNMFKNFIPKAEDSLSTIRTNVSAYIAQLEERVKAWDVSGAVTIGDSTFAKDSLTPDILTEKEAEIEVYKKLIPALHEYNRLLGVEKKEKGGSESPYEERIRVVTDMVKKYDELKKTLTDTHAIQGAFDAYIDAFATAYEGVDWVPSNVKEMSAEDFVENVLGFTDKDRVVEFLEDLAKEPKKAMDRLKVELAKGRFVEEMTVDNRKQMDEELNKQIEDMFGNYEVSMELDKLDISPELATRLFDFKPTTLKEIKNKIQTEIDKISATRGREDELKQLKSFLERVEDLERKSLEERMKEYIKYLRDEQDERIKITLEGQRKINDIEAMTGFNATEKKTMSDNVRKETKEKLAKAEWEAFAKTPEIVHIFDDIDTISTKALNGLHDKLQTLKEDLYNAGLPASELKAILDRINQVEDELNSRNPFKNMGEGFKNLFGGLAAKRLAYEDQIDKQRAADNKVDAERKRLQQLIDNGAVEGSVTYNLFQDKVNQAVAEAEALREETKRITSEYTAAQKSAINFTLAIQEGVSMTQELLTSSLDLAESFGLLSDEQRNIADTSMNILGDIGGLAASAARIASGDVIGGIASAISSTASLITNINKTGDAVKDMDIARQAKNIERLEKSYEKLEKAMDEAYSIEQLKEAQDAMRENINGQIEALERQKAAEESKKNTDQEAVDEYADQIEELEARKAELQKELVEKMGGTYDYSSVAEQFLDAWLTAFNETGDGLSGLEKEFDSFWKDILKKQVIHGGAAAIVQNYVDEINNALKSDSDEGSRFSEEEKKNIEEAKRQAMSNLNEFYDYMNEQYGLSDIEGAGSTGLQSGISGMTEEQADILAAYWNAVRLSVSNIDTKFDESIKATKALLIDSDSPTENPIVSNLKSILEQTKKINTLLNEVRGGSLSNSYIKVQLV